MLITPYLPLGQSVKHTLLKVKVWEGFQHKETIRVCTHTL